MRFIFLLLLVPKLAMAAFVPAYTILLDYQDFVVNANGAYVHRHERKIRIDTPQGIDLYGQAKINYDGKRNNLEIVEAYTIRPNGEKVPVSTDRIKRVSENTDDTAPYFTDQMTAVIIFPQVEVGSQLVYKVVKTEFDPAIKDRFADITPFTPHRRYEDVKISLTHSSDLEIESYARGLEGTKSTLADGRIKYLYSYKQNDAYPTEPGQIEYEDFAPVLQFSNYKGYADLAKITQDLFQPKTQVTPAIQKMADEITAGSQNRKQKAQLLYDWVSKNIRYVGIDVGSTGYEPHYADEILEHRYGDCKDHATILEALLMAAGIPSSPVLIKVAESYQLPHLAGNYYFDHVITYIPEFDLYLDSTAQFAEFGTLPMSDMGKPTLITQTGVVGSTPYSKPENDYTVTTTRLKLMPDGTIVGASTYEPHGYFVTNSRTAQFSYENRDTQSVVDSILKRFQETGTGKMDHPDPSDLSDKWVVRSQYQLDPVINLPGPSAFAIPTGLAPAYIKALANIKPYTGRRFPMSCGSNRHTEQVVLSFPPGVKVSRIPQGVNIKTKDRTYRSAYQFNDNKLYVTRELITNVHGDVCKPSAERTKETAYILKSMKSDMRSQVFVE